MVKPEQLMANVCSDKRYLVPRGVRFKPIMPSVVSYSRTVCLVTNTAKRYTLISTLVRTLVGVTLAFEA